MKSRVKLLAFLSVIAILTFGVSALAQKGGKDAGCTAPEPVLIPVESCSGPGCLDTSFGGGKGRVMAPRSMEIEGVAIQKIGPAGEQRIVAVGSTYDDCIDRHRRWTVARYLMNGTLDTSFGEGGVVYQDLGRTAALAYGVVVQPDGKLVVAGFAPPPTQGQFTLLRYLPNGTLDPAFGTNGIALLPPESGVWGSAAAVALQSDGKIVAVGNYGYQIGVVRLNTDGSLDTSFNGSGQYIFWDARSGGEAIATQALGENDERIIVGGFATGLVTGGNALLFRLNGDGTLDGTFGDSGWTVFPTGAFDVYSGVAIDSENRIVAARQTSAEDGSGSQVAVDRYDPNGTPDASFGSGGTALLAPGRDEVANAIAIQPDGNIVAAGYSHGLTRFAAWRFTTDGFPDPSFGTNGRVETDFTGTGHSLSGLALALQEDDKFLVGGRAYDYDNGLWYGALARYDATHDVQAHDVAVLSVTPSPTGATQGDMLTVETTVANLGEIAESVDVTVTESPDNTNVGTQSDLVLGSGETTTLTFSWLTTSSTTIGEHTLQATATIATDNRPENNSQSTTVSIASGSSNYDISLSATGYKNKGQKLADLEWEGAVNVYIFRDGENVKTLYNSTTWTDVIGVKGGGTHTYYVCDIETADCSNVVTVTF